MIEIAVDIESTGRSSCSVFLVAFAMVRGGIRFPPQVFYMPEMDECFRSPDTMKWWTDDPKRKAFMEKAVAKGKEFTREDVARRIRAYIDSLYASGDELVFYSDFAVFDIGQTNSILEQHGHLPLYLKDDTSPPCECVDHTTYIKGLARIHPNESSRKAFKALAIERSVMSDDHDTEVDIELILTDVINIMRYISQ
jgi:hypothetical protein